jgi:hypothetical protein
MGHTVVGGLLLGHTVRVEGLGGVDRSISGQRRVTRQPVYWVRPHSDLRSPLGGVCRPGGLRSVSGSA